MKIKIVNLKKFLTSIIILVSILFLAVSMLSKTYSYTVPEYITRYVTSGETLWSIAKEQVNENEYYSNKDIRYIIEDLKQINDLTKSDLKLNQELKIPTM